MKKITIYTGQTLDIKAYHPVIEVQNAIKLLEEFINSNIEEISISTNSSEAMMLFHYNSERFGIEINFFLDGVEKGNDLEAILEDFNLGLDLIYNYTKT